jgi:sterol desaturase/sphingolipid hydroxylase (fatty acid hydroxylase superfamily)
MDKTENEEKKQITFITFMQSFSILFIVSLITSIALVYPKYSIASISIQLVFLNLWIYWTHRIAHSLPNNPFNYHIYSHHNKQFHLSRPIELLFECITDFSWFLILFFIKYMFNLDFLSTTLIFFIGLWYSSVHVLNLSLFNDSVHKLHHTEPEFNYGPPYIDYFFGTLKMDPSYTTNNEAFNGIVLFIIFYGLKSIPPNE